MARRLLPGIAGLLAALAAALVFVPAELDRRSLSHSVARAAGSAFRSNAECEPRGGGEWRCYAGDSSGSGGSEYAIRERGNGCWSGPLDGEDGGETPMPHRLDGCVRLRDALRLRERVGYD